jgi:5-formyltetrahydrofolate cyclo-ligase
MMDVVAWRREKRIELYTARKAMTAEQRHEAARRIAGRLDDHCIRRKPELVGLYWPIKYEPNLLAWARVSNLRFCLPALSRVDSRSNIGTGCRATRCRQVFGVSKSRRDGTWRRPT